MKPFSLYIHIPYCYQKCPYCDFNTYAVLQVPEEDYASALLSELDWRAAQEGWKGRPIQTIYFGGGTPSIFSGKTIRKIIAVITKLFPVLDYLEVSLEANPGTVSLDNLSAFHEAGVNRISFGVQSLCPSILKTLGRAHTPVQALSAIESAKAASFKNISLDLMYGVPGQTIADVRYDIAQYLEVEVPHVSAYCLTIEKGTPFYQSTKRGILKLPKDEAVLEMMNLIIDEFETGELNRYEISNFAQDGFEARHNLAYWNGDDYLGIGAGAHSFLSTPASNAKPIYGKRWSNYALPQRYMESAKTIGIAESWAEELDKKGAMFEFFFLGLRKTAGVSAERFYSIFQTTIESSHGELIDILAHEKLLEKEGSFFKLTRRGMELADSVIENFAGV